jgi:hypothetical protein
MNILVVCPECKRQLEVPESAAGKPIRCPGCESVIPADPEFPKRESVTSAPASPPPALLARPHEQERDQFADGEPRRKKKPIRKGASLGLILGLVGGGVLLFLILVGGGVGLLVYFALNRTIPEEEWRPFSPPNSGCTILMPGTPVPQSQTINGILLNKHQVERKREKAGFAVAVFDLNFKVVKPDALEVLTKAERDHMEGRTNGKVTSESAISLGNLPGREFQVVPKDGGLIIERLYLARVGNAHRVYLLVAGGDYIKPNKGDAARFFDSFQLTVPTTPPEFGVGPIAQGPQPPVANPPRPNPVRPVRPQRTTRPQQQIPPGERAIWDETSGTQTISLAFSADSATLAVGHWDKKFRLWDVAGARTGK